MNKHSAGLIAAAGLALGMGVMQVANTIGGARPAAPHARAFVPHPASPHVAAHASCKPHPFQKQLECR